MPLVGLLISKAGKTTIKKNETSGVWQLGDVFPCLVPSANASSDCLILDIYIYMCMYIYVYYVLNGMSMSKWGG